MGSGHHSDGDGAGSIGSVVEWGRHMRTGSTEAVAVQGESSTSSPRRALEEENKKGMKKPKLSGGILVLVPTN
jgi:hypothetical protein